VSRKIGQEGENRDRSQHAGEDLEKDGDVASCRKQQSNCSSSANVPERHPIYHDASPMRHWLREPMEQRQHIISWFADARQIT
jgi:hypothetical protein